MVSVLKLGPHMTQHHCVRLCWQEVMLVGITAPMYAVHAHARSWGPLDSLALLLSTAGALQGRDYVHMSCTSLEPLCRYTHTKHLCLRTSLSTSLGLNCSTHHVVRSICVLAASL